MLQTILKQAKQYFISTMNLCLSVEVKVIKAHNITLTIFVFIYIAPIYIFWKSLPLPQSIVYFISTHTTKSYSPPTITIKSLSHIHLYPYLIFLSYTNPNTPVSLYTIPHISTQITSNTTAYNQTQYT